jgi:membrane protein YdbS with pleckstrin-like domain
METLIRLLRPIYLPLLKLKLDAPHLPEGQTLVRHLRPTEQWLAYRSLAAMFGLLNQFIGVGVGCVAMIVSMQAVGIALSVVALLVECFIIGFALVSVRVDYDLRHYLVGDRSLRVAQGAWTREEVTLSYANIQNIEVMQGPLERLFGFKNLTISTAGADASPGAGASHLVSLPGLPDAEELRALILKMLEQHRGDTGLGDHTPKPLASGPSLSRLAELKEAALALRDAARARR